MKKFNRTNVLLAIAVSALLSSPVAMAEPKADGDRQSKIKMHEQMAETHRKAADCLKANKPMEECKSEMMKNCPMMKAGKKCPMKDMMGEADMSGHEGMGEMDHSKMKSKKQ